MEALKRMGCPTCWPESARQASDALGSLKPVRVIVDDSHYRLVIEGCPQCGQKFIYVMTELIDWAGGDDPICRQRTPITGDEARAILDLDEASAEALAFTVGGGDGRTSIVEDWPKGEDPSYYWAKGLFRREHD